MVERVAKAIAAADERNGGPPYEYRISLGKHAKEHLFDEARAAIEAMKDCDNDILEAMWCAMFQDKFTGHELPMLNAGWVAALVKALEE